MSFPPTLKKILKNRKSVPRILLILAGFCLLAYLFIANFVPINNRILALFFPKPPSYAATMKKETEFYSNQLLIKVKKTAKGKIKEGNGQNTGIPSLNSLSKAQKVVKIERVIKVGKKSSIDADIFDWYVVTFAGDKKVVNATFDKETKKVETNDPDATVVLSRAAAFEQNENVEKSEPNSLIVPFEVGCEGQMSLWLQQITFTVGIGDTVNNTLFVKNNGSSTCGPKTISATYPGGWTQTLSQSSVTVAPGATVSVPFTVKVGANTVTNTYDHYLWLATFGAGATLATFQVAGVTPGPTNTPIPTPSLPPGTICTNTVDARLQNATITAQPGQAVTNTLLVKNPNPTACGSNTYIYSRSFPAGWDLSIQNSVTVEPGQTVSVPFIITVPSSASVSSYNYSITTYNIWADGSGQSIALGNVNVSIPTPTSVVTPTVVISTPTATPTPSQTPVAANIPNDPYYSSSGSWGQAYPDLWGLKKIDMEGAWAVSTGSADTVIAVIDSGVDRNHEDLAANMWVNTAEQLGNSVDDDGNGYIDDYYGWDMVSDDNDPMDTLGHGTVVAGALGAVGNNGKGIVGVNWRTKIMPVRILGDSNTGTWEDGAQGIVYAADMGAKVINNSWGGNYYSQIAQDAARYAHDKGAVVVAAAGNDGSDVILVSPAGNERVIAVGAVDNTDARSFGYWSSNYGVRLDVSAPGVDILSTKSTSGSCLGHPMVGSAYCRVPGTSLASPFVAGLAGLLLSKYPTLSNEEVRQILRSSSTDIGTSGFDMYYGYGRINAANAMQLAAVRPLAPVIKSPMGRSTVWGTQTFLGSADGPDFASYTLEGGQSITPSSWTMLKSSTSPVSNGSLAEVNLSTLPIGQYSFRLTAKKVSGVAYQFQTFMVNVGQPTPTPTATPTPLVTPTPVPPTPTPQPSAPRNVIVTPDGPTTIVVLWVPPLNGPTVAAYNVYRDGNRVSQGSFYQYKDINLTPSTLYTYIIEPQYQDGSVGPKSVPVSGMTMAQVTPTNSPTPSNTPTPIFTPTRVPTPTPTPDSVPPTVNITSPSDNEVVKDSVVITATATDPSGVEYLQYYRDDVLIGTQTIPPYSFNWDSHSVTNGFHTIGVKAFDTLGNNQQVTISVTVNNPDITPPTNPSSLTGSAVGYNKVDLNWSPSVDNVAVVNYWIIRDGTTVAMTPGTSFSDTTVQPNTQYGYQVVAVDAAGNSSGVSNTLTLTTPSQPDTEPPSIPGSVLAMAISSSQINISWAQSTDNVGISTYDIYRGGIFIASVTTTSFGDIGLQASKQYSYYVRAKDAAGNVSGNSTTVTATTLNPPTSYGAIAGVVSASGKKLVNAKISFVVNAVAVTTYTDLSGKYSVGNINPGTYTVTYSAVGYKSQTVKVTVKSGTTTTKNVTLNK